MNELINYSCVVCFMMVISGQSGAKPTDEPVCKQTEVLIIRILNNPTVSVFFSNLISKVQQLIRIDRVSLYHVQSHSPNKSSLQFSDFLL